MEAADTEEGETEGEKTEKQTELCSFPEGDQRYQGTRDTRLRDDL